MSRSLTRSALAVLALVVVVYVGILAYVFLRQRDLQYNPFGEVTPLSTTALTGAEAVAIPSDDGSPVAGWFQAPQPGLPVILYLKGNSDTFSAEHERFEQWVADGYGFLAFDYRGFPASPGTLNQDNVLADALVAYDWLSAMHLPIVLWGRSLGSGPATFIASEREVDALLLETPFLSAVAVAGERYPFLPVGWLMADQYPVNSWIADVEEPVFVAHGTADQTIGVSNGERLYELVRNPYGLWIEPGADHGDLWERGIWDRAQDFFAEVREREAAR